MKITCFIKQNLWNILKLCIQPKKSRKYLKHRKMFKLYLSKKCVKISIKLTNNFWGRCLKRIIWKNPWQQKRKNNDVKTNINQNWIKDPCKIYRKTLCLFRADSGEQTVGVIDFPIVTTATTHILWHYYIGRIIRIIVVIEQRNRVNLLCRQRAPHSGGSVLIYPSVCTTVL